MVLVILTNPCSGLIIMAYGKPWKTLLIPTNLLPRNTHIVRSRKSLIVVLGLLGIMIFKPDFQFFNQSSKEETSTRIRASSNRAVSNWFEGNIASAKSYAGGDTTYTATNQDAVFRFSP